LDRLNFAGIILAAGASSRFGKSKILVPWQQHTLLHRVTSIVLRSGLNPVIVVLGNVVEDAILALSGLPATVIINPEWEKGQSTSLRCGIQNLPNETSAAIIFLADQPFISPALIDGLLTMYKETGAPIIAPLVEGERCNPVLFAQTTFNDLLSVKGDVGGRAIFSKFQMAFFPWQDKKLKMDIDTPQDLEVISRLIAEEQTGQQQLE
jgi:molybdenum cofactor cytidylyltransferase